MAVDLPNINNASADAPAVAGEAVTLGSDWTPTLAKQTRGLWVGGAGTVKVDFAGSGTGISLLGVTAGYLLPLSVTKVYSTGNGTSATNIVALY